MKKIEQSLLIGTLLVALLISLTACGNGHDDAIDETTAGVEATPEDEFEERMETETDPVDLYISAAASLTDVLDGKWYI